MGSIPPCVHNIQKPFDVKVLSGISGSGKSRLAAKLLAEMGENRNLSGMIVSADHYFEGRGENGEYLFNPAELGKAHQWCFRAFLDALQVKCNLVIVDNTNTSAEEIAPYILAAESFGFTAEILTVMCDPGIAWKRNQHNVPFNTVSQQNGRIISRKLPPWWNERVVEDSSAKFR